MVQEDKELLLQDLCARLLYGVKCQIKGEEDFEPLKLKSFIQGKGFYAFDFYIKENSSLTFKELDEFKPYLFPLSSMTEEQFMELKVFADLTYEGNTLELVEWDDNYKTLEFWLEEIPSYHLIKVFDWLNKNHFDYRGLIEKGLALNATGKNIY